MPMLTAELAARLFAASAREDTEDSVPFPLTGRPSGLKQSSPLPVARAEKRVAGAREAVSTKRSANGRAKAPKRGS